MRSGNGQATIRWLAVNAWLVGSLFNALIGTGPVEARGLGQQPEAKLRVVNFLPHWVYADATESIGSRGRPEFYRFWVTDEAGRIIRGPVDKDGGHYYVALPNGKYRVHVQVSDATPASNPPVTDTTASPVEVVHATTVLSTTSSQTTAICSTSGSFVTCTLSTDDDNQTIDLAQVASQVGASNATTLWFVAWGARGGYGESSVASGGKAGHGGNAVTVTTVSDFESQFGTTTIYYYVGRDGSHGYGGSGGASTVVATQAASGSISLDKIVLIAGGGGGGGGAFYFANGHAGGDGGCALAIRNSGSAVTGAGGNGAGNDPGGGGDGSTGGSLGGSGQAIESGYYSAGTGGIGGNGGYANTAMPGWLNSSPDFGNNGLGGHGAAGGGGGYGGGGSTGDGHAGAGGGGSYAMVATRTNGNAPTSCSGMDSNGVIHIVFDLET